MKIFISWSGKLSQSVALGIRDWLPSVIQSVEPYVSSEDIDKGARWSIDVAKELEDSQYGILCVTPDNVDAPWLNFEAGALSRSINRAFVSPFLFGLKKTDIQGPIVQFQLTVYEKDDIQKLLRDINKASGNLALEQVRLDITFEVWWPRLKEVLDPLLSESSNMFGENLGASSPEELGSKNTQMLEEILETVRFQQKLLGNPEDILPPDYLTFLFERLVESKIIPSPENQVWRDLKRVQVLGGRLMRRSQLDGEVSIEGLRDFYREFREVTERILHLSGGIR